MDSDEKSALLLAAAIILAILICLFAGVGKGFARDLGQWTNSPPEIREWFKHLMMPDNPGMSCCGEGDAYWADSFEVDKDGNYVAIITDPRPDEPLQRVHVDIGTKITVPKQKLVDATKQQNPTGHGIIFLARGGPQVYCYLAPGGV